MLGSARIAFFPLGNVKEGERARMLRQNSSNRSITIDHEIEAR